MQNIKKKAGKIILFFFAIIILSAALSVSIYEIIEYLSKD
jgi:hypothetical protein